MVSQTVSNLIFLNQNAVSLVAQGKTLAALRLLQSALHATMENVRQRHAGCGNSQFMIQPIEVATANEEPFSPHNAFRVFGRLFLMTEAITDPDEVALVLLYNFALTLQIQGLATGKNHLLRKSLNVYGWIGHMVAQNHGIPTPDFKLLLLALSMNQGYLHSHFVCFSQAQKCASRIHELLNHSFDLPMETLLFFHQSVIHVDFSLAPTA